MSARATPPGITATFESSAAQPKQENARRRTKPIPIRFTESELVLLKGKAGQKSLSTYCRDVLLGADAEKRKSTRSPLMGDTQYAALLSALGESRLSSNLNQLAKHANMGTLDVSDNVEEQLQDAYLAVLAMRDALLTALKVKVR